MPRWKQGIKSRHSEGECEQPNDVLESIHNGTRGIDNRGCCAKRLPSFGPVNATKLMGVSRGVLILLPGYWKVRKPHDLPRVT